MDYFHNYEFSLKKSRIDELGIMVIKCKCECCVAYEQYIYTPHYFYEDVNMDICIDVHNTHKIVVEFLLLNGFKYYGCGLFVNDERHNSPLYISVRIKVIGYDLSGFINPLTSQDLFDNLRQKLDLFSVNKVII